MIDPAKTYRTRDNREVRIYAVDASDDGFVHGAVKNGTKWNLHEWFSNGHYFRGSNDNRDLIEVKPKHVRWVNVYEPTRVTPLYESKQEADTFAAPERLACIRIEFEEGEGL